MDRNRARIGEGYGALGGFRGRKNRNVNWKGLFLSVCDSEGAYERLTAVWNLDWDHWADKNHVALHDLAEGAKVVLSLMAQSKPRVMSVTLTNRTADVFGSVVTALGYP